MSEDIAKIGNELPAYLQDLSIEANSVLQEHRIIPMLGIIQKQHKTEFQEQFGLASVVAYNVEMLQAKKGEVFEVQPVFGYHEFVHLSDHLDQTKPKFIARTFSEDSPIAQMSRGKETRSRTYHVGEKAFTERFQKRLNFIVRVLTGPLGGELAVMTFYGGEHGTGDKLANEIMMRRAPLWATKWRMATELHEHWERKNEEWFGFRFEFAGFIEEADLKPSEEIYRELKKEHEARAITVVGEEDDPDMDAFNANGL